MHYVKHFNINGVDTKQVACIELQGKPNAATEGAVGVLGMDMLSPTHDVYRCVAVNGSVYTWELLSAGMSIISANITGQGGETNVFPYSELRVPNNYIIKIGDLILDSEGYLYQITSLGVDSCIATYCSTHIGSGGGRDYSMRVKDGKLQLVTENGNVVSNVDYCTVDDETVSRNPSTGALIVNGIMTIDGTSLKLFVGTNEEYENLTSEQKQNLFAIITDDETETFIWEAISQLQTGLENGEIVVHTAEVLDPNIFGVGVIDGSGEISLDSNSLYSIQFEGQTYMLFVNDTNKGYSTRALQGGYIYYDNGWISCNTVDGEPVVGEYVASFAKIMGG